MDYLKLFSSLPNFNLNKQIVLNDGYNPTLYKWDGRWLVSWICDDGESLIEIVGNSPEDAIINAVEYMKEHYQVSIEETLQPQFTLTPEEVELVEYSLEILEILLSNTSSPTPEIENTLLEMRINANILHSKIKQWQDENRTI